MFRKWNCQRTQTQPLKRLPMCDFQTPLSHITLRIFSFQVSKLFSYETRRQKKWKAINLMQLDTADCQSPSLDPIHQQTLLSTKRFIVFRVSLGSVQQLCSRTCRMKFFCVSEFRFVHVRLHNFPCNSSSKNSQKFRRKMLKRKKEVEDLMAFETSKKIVVVIFKLRFSCAFTTSSFHFDCGKLSQFTWVGWCFHLLRLAQLF